MFSEQVGKELKSIRDKRGETLEEVSKHVKIHKNTLSIYENDSKKIQMKKLEELLDYYGLNMYYFFKQIYDYNHNLENSSKKEGE